MVPVKLGQKALSYQDLTPGILIKMVIMAKEHILLKTLSKVMIIPQKTINV